MIPLHEHFADKLKINRRSLKDWIHFFFAFGIFRSIFLAATGGNFRDRKRFSAGIVSNENIVRNIFHILFAERSINELSHIVSNQTIGFHAAGDEVAETFPCDIFRTQPAGSDPFMENFSRPSFGEPIVAAVGKHKAFPSGIVQLFLCIFELSAGEFRIKFTGREYRSQSTGMVEVIFRQSFQR